jgi:WD40 repeat protein
MVWSVPPADEFQQLPPIVLGRDLGPLRAVAAVADGSKVAAAGDKGEILLWDATGGKGLGTIAGPGGAVLSLAISPNGDRILAGLADRTARLYDADDKTPIRTLAGHAGPVNGVAFSPDGGRLATAGGEGGVKVWESATGNGVIAFGHAAPNNAAIQPIQAVAFNGDGALVTASADKTLKCWAFEGSWSERATLGPHVFRVLALDFSPDGTLLAAGGGEPSRSGEVKVWEVGTGKLARSLDALHSDTVFGLRFSPDGASLATAAADKLLKVTRVADGKELKTFEGHTHHVLAVDWKSDGKQLASCGGDNVIKTWDFTTGEQLKTLAPAGKQLTALRWPPGKPELAGASGDKSVRLWNPDSGEKGQVTRTFGGPNDFVYALAVSADGGRVAAGCADGVLFVWNGQNAQVLRKIDPPPTGATVAQDRPRASTP